MHHFVLQHFGVGHRLNGSLLSECTEEIFKPKGIFMTAMNVPVRNLEGFRTK